MLGFRFQMRRLLFGSTSGRSNFLQSHARVSEDAFDPTRFARERKAALHRYQNLPFGAGPRVCVAARFAIVESLIGLSHWLAARRFAITPGQLPVPVARVTLRPEGGMPLIVTALDDN